MTQNVGRFPKYFYKVVIHQKDNVGQVILESEQVVFMNKRKGQQSCCIRKSIQAEWGAVITYFNKN